MKRYLVHGPGLEDLSELLFFDAWVARFIGARIRPRTLAPQYVGYPVPERWPESVLEALAAAERLVTPGDVFLSSTGVLDAMIAGAEATPQANLMEALTGLAADALHVPLHAPWTAADELAWYSQIDGAARSTATRLGRLGHRATSKQFAGQITRVFRPGWDLAFALVLPAFPRIGRAIAEMDGLLQFLANPVTRARREALWEECARVAEGSGLEPGANLRIAERVADCAQWIEASGLSSGRGAFEFLFKARHPASVQSLAAEPLSAAAQAIARIQLRGLAAGELALAATDTPVAMVSSRPRGYPN